MKSLFVLTSLATLSLGQPAPNANAPTLVSRPAEARIQVPAGFSVNEFATGFERPRFMVEGPGEESVILCRDRGGAIHVFQNSCRHRGMKVCRYDEGNTVEFLC